MLLPAGLLLRSLRQSGGAERKNKGSHRGKHPRIHDLFP